MTLSQRWTELKKFANVAIAQITIYDTALSVWITFLPANPGCLTRRSRAKDVSGNKKTSIQEIGDRRRLLARELDFKEFKPSVTTAHGCASSRGQSQRATGSIGRQVGLRGEGTCPPDPEVVRPLPGRGTRVGRQGSHKVIDLCRPGRPINQLIVGSKLSA